MLNMNMRNAFETIDHPTFERALRSRDLQKAYMLLLLSLLYTNQMASANASSKIPTQRGTQQGHRQDKISPHRAKSAARKRGRCVQ